MMIHSRSDSRPYGPNIREEEVIKFGRQCPWLLAIGAPIPVGNPELLIEVIESDAELVWQMTALALASLQRMAQGQADILTETLAMVVGPASTTMRAAPEEPGPLAPSSPVIETFAHVLFGSCGEIAWIIGQSRTELSEIAGEHLRGRASALWRLLGLG